MTDKYTLQARELLADEVEKRGFEGMAVNYRDGDFDGYIGTTVLARILREHDEKQPPQPTFQQRVEAMKRTFHWSYEGCQTPQEEYDRHLAEIMTPKVDPLVEAMDELDWCNPEASASDLRKVLAARGITIPETLP